MIQRNPVLDFFSHLILIIGVIVVFFPIYVTFIGSTQTAQQILTSNPISLLPGSNFIESYRFALFGGKTEAGATIGAAAPMMLISLGSALIIAIGKIAISLLSAFAIVYFRFPFKNIVFWMVFVTLMLPVEVRIGPTYQVVSDLHMLNSMAGLTVPLIASATATFLFRQFFLTVPDELVEAARMDGAGP
ncbi:MAG: ABC transporter permease subunit, partial [Ramlibacter sp.]